MKSDRLNFFPHEVLSRWGAQVPRGHPQTLQGSVIGEGETSELRCHCFRELYGKTFPHPPPLFPVQQVLSTQKEEALEGKGPLTSWARFLDPKVGENRLSKVVLISTWLHAHTQTYTTIIPHTTTTNYFSNRNNPILEQDTHYEIFWRPGEK